MNKLHFRIPLLLVEYDIAKRQISIPKFFNLLQEFTGIDPEMCSPLVTLGSIWIHGISQKYFNSCEAWSKHDTLTPMHTPWHLLCRVLVHAMFSANPVKLVETPVFGNLLHHLVMTE